MEKTFTSNKSDAYFLNIEPNYVMFLATYNTEFNEIIITFTDQMVDLQKQKIKLI